MTLYVKVFRYLKGLNNFPKINWYISENCCVRQKHYLFCCFYETYYLITSIVLFQCHLMQHMLKFYDNIKHGRRIMDTFFKNLYIFEHGKKNLEYLESKISGVLK